MAIEVGTHSPWVSRLLSSLGHEVIVANARQVKLISTSQPEGRSAGCADPGSAGASGSAVAAADPAPQRKGASGPDAIRVRAALVDTRTSLVNAARGLAKATGERLPGCDADQMGVGKLEGLPAELRRPLEAAVGAGGIADGADQRVRSEARAARRTHIRKPNCCGR